MKMRDKKMSGRAALRPSAPTPIRPVFRTAVLAGILGRQ